MRTALAISLVIATAAFAAEQAQPARGANAPAPDEGLAGMRKEFEAVKKLREGLPQAKDGLPQIGAPTLDIPSATPASRNPTKQKMEKAGKKSATWLVDAMEKEKKESLNERSGRPVSRDELAQRDAKLSFSADDKIEAEANTPLVEQAVEPEKIQPPERKIPTHNPLNPFLADWMTPGDYAMLKPALRESELGGVAGLGSLGSASVEAGLPAGPIESLAGLSGIDRSIAASSPAKANPYLQTLELPAPPPAVFAPMTIAPSPIPAQPAASAIFSAPAPMPQTPAKVPDFVRPLPDEKHFKQLKRF